MNQILGADGTPIKTEPDPKDQSTKEETPPVKIPLPVEGDLLAGIFVNEIIEETGGTVPRRTVNLRFQAHAALSPMELLTILNEFAMSLQAPAQKQMARTIQRAPANALDQLKRMGVPLPSIKQ